MIHKMVDAYMYITNRKLVLSINNQNFMYSTQEQICHLKSSNEVLHPLRYMVDQTANKVHIIMMVTYRQMKDFKRSFKD